MKQRTHRWLGLFLVLVSPLVLMAGSASAQQAVNTAFTYQGQLKRDGGAFSGDCAFRFGLWNAETGGGEIASQAIGNAPVRNGLFTVQLDFGNQFTGDARWLEVQVLCAGDATATTLTPRILLTSSPYAIGLMPGAEINGAIAGTTGVMRVINRAAGAAILGMAVPSEGQTFGILGNAFSPNGIAVSGYTENGGTAMRGLANDSGYGVHGSSGTGYGVYGKSTTSVGIVGESEQYQGVLGIAHIQPHGGVVGFHDGGGVGVYGRSDNGTGVVGTSKIWVGAYGESVSASGVLGKSTSGVGVSGESDQNEGVRGISRSGGHGGVVGVNENGGIGVYGSSATGDAIWGQTNAANKAGIVGINTGGGLGIYGNSATGDGIAGTTNANNKAGVVAVNNGNGNGLYARSNGGGFAGFFDGKMASKSVHILGGADLAEWYQVSSPAAPGTLLVIDPAHPGQLMPSQEMYDTRVAGVVSGAGGVNPGLTLQQTGVLDGDTQVAVAGRVYVQAEANSAPIQPGDLLTTSAIPGHAMKAADRDRAYGAVIGKALTGLDEGTGLVLVLINLQ